LQTNSLGTFLVVVERASGGNEVVKIFISYRREGTSESVSGRIYPILAKWFGKNHVFKDVDNIRGGDVFPEEIQDALEDSDVFLAVIGPGWIDERYLNGQRKLDNPGDWVRIEIETALKLGLTIIPILLKGATWPTENDLPQSLHGLLNGVLSYNYRLVREDPDFSSDVMRLIRDCEHAIAKRRFSGKELTERIGRSLVETGFQRQGQLRTLQAGTVALLFPVVVVVTAIAVLAGFALHGAWGSFFSPTPPSGPALPLHVLAPGEACDPGWSHAYWTNYYGATNCLDTYTRIITQNPTCPQFQCIGSVEFGLAAQKLKLPAKYTISVVATFMVGGQPPVAGTQIGLVLPDFQPSKPVGLEYVIIMSAQDQTHAEDTIGAYDCHTSGCVPKSGTGASGWDATKSHTFGFYFDGKTTYAELDGTRVDMKSSKPPSSFWDVQLVVLSPNHDTSVSANFSDFRIQPN
jgi:hypothetical protein